MPRNDGFHRITNVSKPTLTLYQATRKGDTLAPAMMICADGGSIHCGRFIDTVQGNQEDMLACAGVPLDRPIGIATKQITEMMARV